MWQGPTLQRLTLIIPVLRLHARATGEAGQSSLLGALVAVVYSWDFLPWPEYTYNYKQLAEIPKEISCFHVTCNLVKTLLNFQVCHGILRTITNEEIEVLAAVVVKVRVFLNMPPHQSTRRHIPGGLGHKQTMQAKNIAFVDGQGKRNMSHNDVTTDRIILPILALYCQHVTY